MVAVTAVVPLNFLIVTTYCSMLSTALHVSVGTWTVALSAGVSGFGGNEIAAQIRTRAGKRLSSAALVADGNHARVDGFVSLGVLASAVVVGLGVPIADPIIGLIITLVILRITWDSWHTVREAPVG